MWGEAPRPPYGSGSIRCRAYGDAIPRRLALVSLVVALSASGIAVAATLSPGDVGPTDTVTLTIPAVTHNTITVNVPQPGASERLAAALADPAAVHAVDDPRARKLLTHELASLDAFIATRKTLVPYRAHIWYVAHHARPPVSARRVAALLWCTVWFPHACG